MKNKTKTVKKERKPLLLIVFAICAAVLFLCFYLSVGLSSFVEDQMESNAQNSVRNDGSIIRYAIEDAMSSAERVAAGLSDVRNEDDLQDRLGSSNAKLIFTSIQYYNGAVAYNTSGTISSYRPEEVESLIAAGNKGMSRIFYNTQNGEEEFAFYVPITNNSNISGITCYYSVAKLREVSYFGSVSGGNGAFLIDTDGNIVMSQKDITYANIFEYFSAGINDSAAADSIKAGIFSGNIGVDTVTLLNERSIIAYSPLETTYGNWYLVSVCPEESVVSAQSNMYYQIIIIGVTLSVLFIIIFVYLWFMRTKHDDDVSRIKSTDSLTGCNNINKFYDEAETLVGENRKTNFAFVYLGIQNFEYINDHFGHDVSDETIQFLAKVIGKSIDRNETFGRVSNDNFVILYRFRNINDVVDRFKLLYTFMYSYDVLKEKGYNVKLQSGIYAVDREKKFSMHEMMDRAMIAMRSGADNSRINYVIYDENIRQKFVKKAEIESDMETSLKNDDFKVFFQPKYNIKKNRMDGAEALVRWNHPTRGYVLPDDFVPIFEQNGFIAQLDRYVFIQTCKFIRRMVDDGRNIVPISVNVSRVNAIQPEFINFYIEHKNEYQIADGFIELEFTESFALESYDTLGKIINSLKSNGIQCSIDDFGSGYSSFSALKELQMDALKLDKFFLNKGSSPKKDAILLSSMIKLAKDFGMHTIQEGVESASELKMLRDMGCDTIQGFLYARPMGMDEFEKFLNTAYGSLPIETLRKYYGDDNFHPEIDSVDTLGLKKPKKDEDD